ncbi:hypothetical protein CCACVL1_06912 [Corchorus capsularis]|uniref:Uncharacterized protein n=1 Tax=Corchorus capsularis TaxID=210143 RepID=A0A1R3JBJ6_COCAP|nr:hypothetical protein CCACVL1_06912 [Corchorus capsularis]
MNPNMKNHSPPHLPPYSAPPATTNTPSSD